MFNSISSVFTEATCGEACWHAKEDICRCSCGGKNHGVLKTPDGISPTRTSKINGDRYELRAVGSYADIYTQGEQVNKNYGPICLDNRYTYYYRVTDKHAPAVIKPATILQTNNWSELSSYKHLTRIELYRNPIYLLWIKIEGLA